MPRKPWNRGEEVFNLNLTPLLDVVLQLITFFMMLIHFGSKLEGATKDIRLPIAPAALPGKDLSLDRLVVLMDREGKILLDSGAIDGDAADAWWAEQGKRRVAGQETLGGPTLEIQTVVIIRADRDVPYGKVRRTLATAQERGFAHFTLVVMRGQER